MPRTTGVFFCLFGIDTCEYTCYNLPMIDRVIQRRLQPYGHGSIAIILPKGWCEDDGIGPGTLMEIRRRGRGYLIEPVKGGRK